MATCTSITKLEEVSSGYDMLLVTIDEDIKAYMIFKYADCLQFVNQEVIVSYRQDIYNGKIETFINTLTVPTRVTTLDREDKIKLYCNQEDNNSNVCVADMEDGSTFLGAILYCTSCSYEGSKKASWVALKVRDKAGRITTLRLFDYDTAGLDFSGMYIKANVKKKRAFGLQTDEIRPMDLDFAPNPEVTICKTFIANYFLQDSAMYNVLNRTKLLDYMEEFIDLEKGYLLVRAAVELDLLEELKNMFDDVDFQALSYAILLRYGYTTKVGLDKYSVLLKTLTFTMQQGLPANVATTVLQILDADDEDVESIPERGVYKKVCSLADEIIKVKKAV